MTEPPRPRGPVDDPARPGRDRPVNVGVLSPVTGGFFFGQVLAGVVAEVGRVGGRVTLLQTLDAGQTSDILPVSDATLPVGWDHIDAFVNIAWATSPEYLARARAAGRPVVLASNELPNVDAAAVVVDNVGGIVAAVEHLAREHGLTRIGFVGHVGQSDIAERHVAYQQAMRDAGLTPLELVDTPDQVEHGGEAVAARVAAAGWEAAVAGTDRVALGLVAGLRAQGVEVPRDLAVIGFDDAEAGWYVTPSLTTVRQHFQGLGATAAGLAVAEARGHAVRHERYTVPAEFVVRRSCGCTSARTPVPPAVGADADALVAALGELLGAPALADGVTDGVRPPTQVDRDRIDETIHGALERLLRLTPSPESVEGFAQSIVRRIAAAAAGVPAESEGRRTLQDVVARFTVLLAREQAVRSSDRVQRLADALAGQFGVGMSLLGRSLGDDPADLGWLETLGVRAGCLGLWTCDGQTTLRVAGVHDDLGTLDDLVGTTVGVQQFPPADVLRLADAARGDVAYVIPVRGASGDHGLLCVVAPVDMEFGTQRATYDHWAALLGAALREQRLLEEVRHSEERYALASRAAADGLWEWDVASGDVYLSARARELLDVAADEAELDATALVATHPDDREMVRETLATALDQPEIPAEVEARVLRQDGQVGWVLIRALGVPATDGRTRGLVGSISDVDQRKQLEEQLRRAALYDAVTGLPNRRLFLDRLHQAIEQPRRRREARFAVLFLDLDGFKVINDSLGHLMGDELLQVVGERLRADLRSVDTAARFGGDEFAVLLTDPVPEDLLVVARRIQRKIAAPVRLGEQEVSVTASIGITTSATPYSDAEDVLRDADIAMYRAKESERGTACIFDPQMHLRALDRLRTRTELQGALDRHEFVVHYQPIVGLDDTEVDAFEALVRWDHPERGLLPPSEFLPFMAGNSAIVVLGHQVLEQVCAQVAEWRRVHRRVVRVSVNLSHREFWAADLLSTVLAALERHGLPPAALVLEITESVIMTDPDAARAIMDELHEHGLRLHIDDFGTGHSSLHVLRTFPVDALKIDGSFVRELAVVEQTTALVRTIIAMSRVLGLDVVAECVETVEQADELRAMGCAVGQGWLFARALPPGEAGRLVGSGLRARPDTAP